jgi:hypothetical protein
MPCRAASSAHAREAHVCASGTSYQTRAQMHMRGVHTLYIPLIRACLYIQAGTHTRTRCRRAHRRRAQSHAHAHGRDAATCTLTAYSSHKHPSIYRDRTRLSLQIDTNLYTHMARSAHTRARSHAQAFVATHLYALHVPTGDAYKDDDLYIHAFAYISIGQWHGRSSRS